MTETETTEYVPDLFNAKAQLRPLDSYAPDDLARMSDVRRELFYSAHKALSEAAEVEAAAAQGDTAEREAKAVLDMRRKTVETLIPPWTAHDEWKRVVKKIERPEPEPEVKAAHDLAREQLATAEAELVRLSEHVRLCHSAVKPARKFAADQWQRYHDRYPPKTASQVHREMMDADMARKRAGIVPQVQPRVFASELDRAMSVKKGGDRRASRHPDASGRTYSAEMRNQTIAPPAEAPWQVKPRGGK